MLPCFLYPRLHRCPVVAQPRPSDRFDSLDRALCILAIIILFVENISYNSTVIKHLHTSMLTLHSALVH